MPISPEAGRLLYTLVRASRPDTVVEFGTSFGISTIYLAAAVADNGSGGVVTTELAAAKIAAARANLEEAGVGGPVTILAGDAGRPWPTYPAQSVSSCWTGGRTSACPCCACWNPGSPPARSSRPTTAASPAWRRTSSMSGTRPTGT